MNSPSNVAVATNPRPIERATTPILTLTSDDSRTSAVVSPLLWERVGAGPEIPPCPHETPISVEEGDCDDDTRSFIESYLTLSFLGRLIVRNATMMLSRGASKDEFQDFVDSMKGHEEFPKYRSFIVNTLENWPIKNCAGGRL